MKSTVEKRFIYLAVIFGILFLMLIPPFQSPDEDSHFKKAYVLSGGNFFPDIKDGKKGYYLPEDMVKYIDKQLKVNGKLEQKFSYADLMESERGIGIYEKQQFDSFSTVSSNPVAHIVPAIGIVLGRIVAKIAGIIPSYVCLLYFARMANLIGYIILSALAIRMTPILKKTFCLLGIMPMALFLASTVSYDMLLIGAGFLFSAICFRLLYDKEYTIGIKEGIILGVIAFLFYVLKVVYLPIFILLFIILIQKYDKKKIIKWMFVMLGVFAVLLILTSYIPEMLMESSATGGGGTSVAQQQTAYVLSHPMQYLGTFFHTLDIGRNFYISSTVGLFGLLDTPLITVFTYLYLFVLVLTGISEISIDCVTVKWYERVGILLAVGASFFGIFLAMYLYWTPLIYGVGAPVVEGVQGRYFLPLLSPLFLVFANKWILKRKYMKRTAEAFIEYSALAGVAILLVSMLTILLRFWV